MDDIKILKEMEQEQYDDAEQMKGEPVGRATSAEAVNQGSKASAYLLIAAGLIGLLLMQTAEPWSYWWLIFFAKPFMFGWFGTGRFGWGFCNTGCNKAASS